MEIKIVFGDYRGREQQKKLNNMDEMKYKRDTQFVKDYVVFDFETTGFNCYNDEVIEIGAIKYKDFVEVERFSSIIKPDNNIDPYILELTGITPEEVDKAPKLEDVIDEFVNFIGELPLLAHNASFDMRFLMYSLIKTKREFVEFTSIDTLTLSRRYIDETKNHKLRTLKGFLKLDNVKSHRAIDDCNVTNELYKLCYSRKDDIKYASNISSRKSLNLYDLKADSVEGVDEDHPLYDVNICFTGALNDLTRREVGQILVNLGAKPQNGVTIKTEFLVLGEESYIDFVEKNKKSSKLNKAIKYRDIGQDIKIISEGDFIDILETQSKD